jgi:DNA-binding NtrC family response regulator
MEINFDKPLPTRMVEIEMAYIQAALDQAETITGAAKLLKVTRTMLSEKMRRWGMKTKRALDDKYYYSRDWSIPE